MVHSVASTVLEAQPAGHMLHHGSCAGGRGQPERQQLSSVFADKRGSDSVCTYD